MVHFPPVAALCSAILGLVQLVRLKLSESVLVAKRPSWSNAAHQTPYCAALLAESCFLAGSILV